VFAGMGANVGRGGPTGLFPGPPLRCSPGYGNARAVGPFARRELDAGRHALFGVFPDPLS
jgi:hypothetical protein